MTTTTATVTQADREAAAAMLKPLADGDPIWRTATVIRAGGFDDHGWVQAFARHRTASSPPQVQGQTDALREAIAALIRENHKTRNDRVEDEYTISFPTTHHGEYQAADAILAALTATPPTATTDTRWYPQIGEEVRTTEALHERFGEWRGIRLWIAEVRAERGRGERVNVTVTEEWPMGKQATLTDGFYVGDGPDDLAPAPPSTKEPGDD